MIRPAAKALNKPLLIAGVDMRLAGLALVVATVVGAVNDAWQYKVMAMALFVLVLCGRSQRHTQRPCLLAVWNQARKHRWLYDPAKRRWFQILFVRDSETE